MTLPPTADPTHPAGGDPWFMAAPVGLLVVDDQGGIVRANPVAAGLLRLPASSLPGRPFSTLVVAESQAPLAQTLQLIRSGGTAPPFDLHLAAPPEPAIPVHAAISRAAEPPAKPAFLVALTDLSARMRHLDAELRLHRKHLELATEAAGLGVWHYDCATGHRTYDRQTCRLLGIDHASFAGTADEFFRVVHPADAPTLKEALARAISDGVSYEQEYRVVVPGGEHRHLRVQGRVVRDDAGRPLHLVGMLWDVSGRKRAELAQAADARRLASMVRLSERRFATAGDLLTQAIEEITQLSESRFGYIYYYSEERREFTLHAWSQAVMPACRIPHVPMVYALDRTGVWGEAVRQRRPIILNDFAAAHPLKKGYPEGHAPLNRFMTIPVFSEGRIVAVAGVANKAEEYTESDVLQLTQLMNTVWHMTEHRKVEEDLRTALTAAEAANSAKSMFLATMSHEIRTPLNGIIGMTDLLLREEGLTPDQIEMATTVRQCGAGLLTVIGDVLDMAKIESGSIDLQLADIGIRALVAEVAGMFTASCQAKGLRLSTRIAPDVPATLGGYHDRLRRVLVNLLGNAVKFTSQGEVALEVEAVERHDDRISIAWEVRDTGPGIPEDFRDRLFQPFSQADSSFSRQHGGTGLGLAITKRLTELMGGTIAVASTGDAGSRFRVVLPMRLGSPTPATEAAPALGIHRPSWGRTPRILIADDDAVCRRTLQHQLDRLGCACVMAVDGHEAVAAVDAGPAFDLILMDCRMPGCDGYAAAAAIRRREQGGRAPIVAVTANVFTEDRERCRNAGMDDFLAKPLTLDVLTSCLARWIPARPAG